MRPEPELPPIPALSVYDIRGREWVKSRYGQWRHAYRPPNGDVVIMGMAWEWLDYLLGPFSDEPHD